MTSIRRVLCVLALASVMTVPLLAKVVASAVRTTEHGFDPSLSTIPLTDAGATTLSFSGQGKFMISYSAECVVHGTTNQYISLEIVLDGNVLPPTAGFADAFCGAQNLTEFNDGWVTAHYSVPTPQLALGVHTVQIRALVVNSGGEFTGSLGQTSLIVTK
jgi:hypothetical protein